MLMCEVHDSREPDVWLDEAKAKEYGIERTAYYFAFQQLQQENWIEFSRRENGKKRWKIIKGSAGKSANADNPAQNDPPTPDFDDEKSANADYLPENEENLSANTDFQSKKSANADFESGKNPQTRTLKSANADSPLKDEVLKEESSQDSEESFEEVGEPPPDDLPEKIPKIPKKPPKPEKTRLPDDYPLTAEMRKWAEVNLPGLAVDEAHENFIEHWSNRTDAKAEKVDWSLTWKKGMRLAKKWQDEDTAGGRFKPAELRSKNDGKKHGNTGLSDEEWHRRNAHLIPPAD